MLEEECRAADVADSHRNVAVQQVGRPEFVVRTNSEEFRAPTLVVATGGLSIPKMGATGFGYELARQFGLKVQPMPPRAGAAPLERHGPERWCDLAGVSTEVIAESLARNSARRC